MRSISVLALLLPLLITGVTDAQPPLAALMAPPGVFWSEPPPPASQFLPGLSMNPVVGGQPSPVDDPEGDAFDVFGCGAPLHDIGTVEAAFDGVQLNVSIQFFTTIAAPSSGSPNVVFAAFEIDIDQNPATGIAPLQNCFAPPFANLTMGDDYIVDLFNEASHPGMIDILEVSTLSIAGTVPVVYTTDSISFSIPLDILGGDDGLADFTFICGTFCQPTDAQQVVGITVSEGDPFFRGDCNGDGVINITDAIFHLDALVGIGGDFPCQDACDSNDDGSDDIADPIHSLNFIFLDGPAPPAPYPGCGADATVDDLSCESYPFCTK